MTWFDGVRSIVESGDLNWTRQITGTEKTELAIFICKTCILVGKRGYR